MSSAKIQPWDTRLTYFQCDRCGATLAKYEYDRSPTCGRCRRLALALQVFGWSPTTTCADQPCDGTPTVYDTDAGAWICQHHSDAQLADLRAGMERLRKP